MLIIWSDLTTQEYCSVSIAMKLLRSWDGPYVGLTRSRNISDFAFGAANRSTISTTDEDWDADGGERSICDSYAGELCWKIDCVAHATLWC